MEEFRKKNVNKNNCTYNNSIINIKYYKKTKE